MSNKMQITNLRNAVLQKCKAGVSKCLMGNPSQDSSGGDEQTG